MADEILIRQLEKYISENFIEPEPVSEGDIINFGGAKFSVGHYEEKPPDKYDGFVGAIRWQLDKIFDRLEL